MNFGKRQACPATKRLGTYNIQLHYSSLNLYRIEIPSLGMSIHKWTRCPIQAIHCFENNLYCN